MGSLADFEERWAAADVGRADIAEVCSLMDDARTAQRVLEGIVTRLGIRAQQLSDMGVGNPTEDTMRNRGDVSAKKARQDAERAKTASELPGLGEGILDGSVRPENADEVGRARRRLRKPEERAALDELDDEIAEKAAELPPETFKGWLDGKVDHVTGDNSLDELERQRKASFLRTWRKRDGSVGFRGDLDSVRGEAFLAALRSETNALAAQEDENGERPAKDDNLAAEALHQLVQRGNTRPGRPAPAANAEAGVIDLRLPTEPPAPAAGPMGAPRVSISLLVDANTVLSGAHDESICEFGNGGPVPPATMQRFLCNSVITPLLRNVDGSRVDAGRKVRTATLEQEKALRAMYRTCAIDGVTPFDQCEIHHINVFWEHGGPSDQRNMAPVSVRWHHLLHEGGYAAHMHADRSITIHRPDGTLYQTVPAPSPLTPTRRPARL